MIWPLVVAPFAFLAAWLFDRRRRVFADLGTTPTAAVYAGRNEVKGRAWHDAPLPTPITRTPCVWWSYRLEEERTHTRTVTTTDSEGRSHTRTETYTQWHEIDHKSASRKSLHVVDDSGSVEVVLEDASLSPRGIFNESFRNAEEKGFLARLLSFDSRTGNYRHAETGIAVGDELYVVGEASMPEAGSAPLIDHGSPFIVSTRREESHRRTAGIAVPIFVLIGSALAIWGASGLDSPIAVPGTIAAITLLVVAATMLIVFNQLQGHVQSAARAWSLIDVQLTRRSDLIPGLQSVAQAAFQHEHATQRTVADLRGSVVGKVPNSETVEQANEVVRRQTEELRALIAVIEDYPTLQADSTALRLQRELADTENRIAGTRTFYNETVTLLRDKRRTFPGVLIARFADPRRFALFTAEGFERTVPALTFDFDGVA